MRPISGLKNLRWDLSASAIREGCSALISEHQSVLDAVSRLGLGSSFFNTVQQIANLDARLEFQKSILTFPKDVSVDKDVRSAAAAAATELAAYAIKASMRSDVYEVVKGSVLTNSRGEALRGEEFRLRDRMLRDYKRKGLGLSPESRALLEAINTRVSSLALAFQQRVAEWDQKLHFSRAQLAGMTDDFLSELKPSDGDLLEVTLQYPHVLPIQKNCTVPATRRAVELAFNSRGGAENVRDLEEIVSLRRQASHLLSFPNHSTFVLEEKMAKTPSTVEKFLESLQKDLLPLRNADLASLNALKAATEGEDAGPVDMSDYRFYIERELEGRFSLDHASLKPFFPTDAVVKRMMGMYEKLLGLKFTKITEEVGHAPVWHPDVTCWEVKNHREEAEVNGWKPSPPVGSVLGYFYLDLEPREGKYGHAAVFPLVSGCDIVLEENGSVVRQLPVCAMVCNFSKGCGGMPSLLLHDEVETLFHEFGHVMVRHWESSACD